MTPSVHSRSSVDNGWRGPLDPSPEKRRGLDPLPPNTVEESRGTQVYDGGRDELDSGGSQREQEVLDEPVETCPTLSTPFLLSSGRGLPAVEQAL